MPTVSLLILWAYFQLRELWMASEADVQSEAGTNTIKEWDVLSLNQATSLQCTSVSCFVGSFFVATHCSSIFCCNSLLQVPGYQPEEGTPVKDEKADAAMPQAKETKVPDESMTTVLEESMAKAPEESMTKVPEESMTKVSEESMAKAPEESMTKVPEESSSAEVNDVEMASIEVKVEPDEVKPSTGPSDAEMMSPTSPAEIASVDSEVTKVSEPTILPPAVIAELKGDSDMKGNSEVKHEEQDADIPANASDAVPVPCSTVTQEQEPLTLTEAGSTLHAFSLCC